MKLRLKNVSHRDEDLEFPYLIASDTPDAGNSTFRECWGEQATHAAKVIATATTLAQAKSLASAHDVILSTELGREVWRGPKF